jgi:hypothetical protein
MGLEILSIENEQLFEGIATISCSVESKINDRDLVAGRFIFKI